MGGRPLEDIDPKREDVLSSPRRRRHRAKPEPSDALKASKSKARLRALRRPLSPGIMFEPNDGGSYVATSPHSDLDLWELQIADAFGTRSQSVMRSFVADLKALCSKAWDAPNGTWKPNERELNAALAMVADLKPRNTAEAALAAQMIAVHMLTMRLAAQALNRGYMVMEHEAALTGKLARTYATQLEAYHALRGKRRTTRQTITVRKVLHQHVHYHDHLGDAENDGHPHATDAAGVPDKMPSLPSPNSRGQVVPVASRRRKARV